MRVIELRGGFGLENLHVGERPEPTPGPGQVLLRMKAWSLNYRDLMVTRGQYNPKLKLPFVPLSDGVGEVIAIGAGVTRVQVGQRVAGCFMPAWVSGELTDAGARSALGGGAEGVLAEQVVLPQDGVVTVPDHLSDEEAATLPCAAVTAWNALFASGALQPGQTVLVQGTGGVSLFAWQFAGLAGARVILTSSSDDKLQRVADLGGAGGVINYKTTPAWEDKARELTGGVGVDQVVEVGGAGTLPKSLKAVRLGGTISLIGVLTGAGDVNPIPVLMKGIRLQGIFVGSRAMFEAMNRAVALHRLKPVVDRVFGFTEAKAALAYMEGAGHFGKICLTA
jgi:NADPH:quinone reductase-like Zn-dependent oxidoreductase